MPMYVSLFSEHINILRNRYENLMERHNIAAILIHSGNTITRYLDDQDYPYWINPRFCQWVPAPCEADSALLIRAGKRPTLFWLQPVDFWHAVQDAPSGFWTEHFDIQIVSTKEALINSLPRISMTGLGPDAQFLQSCGITQNNPENLCHGLDWLSGIKTPYEQGCIKHANLTAAEGHLAAAKAFKEGKPELDIHLEYLSATRQTENTTPYQNIVALDRHCAILHYHHYKAKTENPGRSLLIDAGANQFHYASDITRTVAREPGVFQDLIGRIDSEVLGIIGKIKPGTSYPALHDQMHQCISIILSESEIIKCSGDEIYEKGYSRAFYPHGLGHLLGILVHDSGGKLANSEGEFLSGDSRYPALRCLRTLEAGMTLTIEPGLYFIPQLLEPYKHHTDFNWPLIDKLSLYGGIRVEDNIVVTETGTVNFTREAFDKLAI